MHSCSHSDTFAIEKHAIVLLCGLDPGQCDNPLLLIHLLKVGSQYDATPYVALHRLRIDTRRNAVQRNARIDLDPILAFLCVASLCLIAKKLNF